MPIIIDKSADNEIITALEQLNIEYYKSCSLDFLYSPVNTHPDMQIHFIDPQTAVAAPSAYKHYKETLPKYLNIIKGNHDPDCTYPRDCAYNVAKLGKKIIGNLHYVDTKIKEIYSAQGYEFVNVNQGYTKCNLCIVDHNSAITEDAGLYKTLSACDLDILKIPHGSVSLKGFDNGFIGGASGFIAENQLAFCGKPSDILLLNKINSFVKPKQVDIIYLSTTNLADYGSIIYF